LNKDLTLCLYDEPEETGQSYLIFLSTTATGLDFAKQAGLAALQKQFKGVSVPDLKGADSVPNLGVVDWTITEIALSTLSLANGSSSVVTQPGTGIDLTMYAFTYTRTAFVGLVMCADNLPLSLSGPHAHDHTAEPMHACWPT
jgi:hypothetical protein